MFPLYITPWEGVSGECQGGCLHQVSALLPALDPVVGERDTGGGGQVGPLVVQLHCDRPHLVPRLDGQFVLAAR